MTCVLLLTLFIIPATAHQFKFGSCKDPKPINDFDYERFSGTWYVHTKLSTSSECLAVKFEWEPENQKYSVQESRLPLVSSASPLDVYVTNVGNLRPVSDGSSAMTLVWEGMLGSLLPYTFTVVETDYDTYALDVECQSLAGFSKRVSASILTRSQTPPVEEQMNQFLATVASQPDITKTRLSAIQQVGCAPADSATYNVRLDNNGISLMSLSGNEEVKKITTLAEAEDYAKKVEAEEGIVEENAGKR
ncbi:hypothetical protein Pmani_011822 [Petrolisthes manimaculis]|uniref:Apolipoprotein D n=1 Tax=Petrolisthes manimaculis TaxID=1843537 RepID=A0AAE1UB46_9EUCA|nr:hypothetical protein Pmani_011822 [Petrolisthes manimaculis]